MAHPTKHRKQFPAPAHLSRAARAWFDEVVATFAMESHHAKLLAMAAEAWDRAESARAAISKGGLTFTDRFGQPKARPEVAVVRDSQIVFARLLRELALDVAAPESRPPSIGRP